MMQRRILPMPVKNFRAYTLIEVMLVIMLLGIMAAFIVPNLLPFNDRWLLRSTAYMMASDIRRMQRQSVQECTWYNFEIHPSQFYYKIRKDETKIASIKQVFLNPRIIEITSTLKPSEFGGELSGYRVLSFNPLGAPGNSGDIVLKTRSGSCIKITIEVVSGRVHVYD